MTSSRNRQLPIEWATYATNQCSDTKRRASHEHGPKADDRLFVGPDAASRSSTLRSYVDVYLREEVQAEALVRTDGVDVLPLDEFLAELPR